MRVLKGLGLRHRQMFTAGNLHVLASLIDDGAADWANGKSIVAEPSRAVRMEILLEAAQARKPGRARRVYRRRTAKSATPTLGSLTSPSRPGARAVCDGQAAHRRRQGP